MDRKNHEKDKCAEGNEAVGMTCFGCWAVRERINVLHFSEGRDVGEKEIFNIIEIRATVSEFAELT